MSALNIIMDLIPSRPEPARPVLPSLASQMGVSLIINENSQVWVVHDKALPDIFAWAEYDSDLSTLTLVYQDGQVQDLGMKIHAPMRDRLLQSRQIYTLLLEGETFTDCYMMPLLVRELKQYNA